MFHSREVHVTHGKKGVALFRATAHNSLKSKAKLSVCGRKRKRVHAPHPFCANSPCHLVAKDTKWETTRRQAAHLSIPTRGVCHIVSLSQRARSSPLIPSSNSALCARAGVEIGGNEHRASERAGANKDGRTTTRKLVAGWHCEWGHRGWNAAAADTHS